MCDPFWTGIPAGSLLDVSIEQNTGVGVRCRVVIDAGDSSAAGECRFPLVVTPGLSGTVDIDLASTGAEATVVIVSKVTTPQGAVIRGPDRCEIRVPAGAAVATQVIFST